MRFSDHVCMIILIILDTLVSQFLKQQSEETHDFIISVLHIWPQNHRGGGDPPCLAVCDLRSWGKSTCAYYHGVPSQTHGAVRIAERSNLVSEMTG